MWGSLQEHATGAMRHAVAMARPELWMCRHGQTEWSRDGRHTSHTDLPLTPEGVAEAQRMAPLLAGVVFDLVLRSPLGRSGETAAAAGFPEAKRDPALAEWDYGDYEGVTTAEIREDVPGWTVFTHPSPGGESAEQVAARADRVGVVADGRLVELGTHDELLAADGRYAALYQTWIAGAGDPVGS